MRTKVQQVIPGELSWDFRTQCSEVQRCSKVWDDVTLCHTHICPRAFPRVSTDKVFQQGKCTLHSHKCPLFLLFESFLLGGRTLRDPWGISYCQRTSTSLTGEVVGARFCSVLITSPLSLFLTLNSKISGFLNTTPISSPDNLGCSTF